MNDMEAQVNVKAELSDPFFKVRQTLKQGDRLAPTLFNLVLEHTFRKLKLDLNSTLQYKYNHILGYGNNTGIMAKLRQTGIDTMKALGKAAKETGLRINITIYILMI